MNMFIDIVRSRKTCRRFTAEPLTDEEKALLTEAGSLAPTSRNLGSVRIHPVDDIEVIRRLAACKDSGATALETATYAVVVAADTSIDTWVEDASIASILLQMEAEDLGIGSCWIQVRMRRKGDVSADDVIHGIMGLPRDVSVLSIIAFGRKAE